MQKILLVATGLLASTQAWWSDGHMIVARVAYDVLMDSNPDLITRAEGILKELSQFTTLEDAHPFVECANFADKIKSKGFHDQSHWHFVDTPYLDGIQEDIPNNIYNITWALGEMKYGLKYARPSSSDSVEYGRKGVKYALGDSLDLRLMIHYVGDIHQPLHTVTRYTQDMPQGDRGGNSFPLEKHGSNYELHALWDSAVAQYKTDYALPLSDYHWNKLGTISETLRTTYPQDSIEELNNDYTTWSEEGYKIAKDFVYVGVQEGGWPSDEYMTKGAEIANRQLVKGGYRLANIFIDMWANSAEEEQAPSTFLN